MTNSSSSSSSLPRTYYNLLGIDQDANPKEIEKAYKRQALIHHPDRNPNDSQTQSTNKFQKLAEAYQVLRDPVKRTKYDLKVANTFALHSQSAHPPPSAPNLYPNRPASQQSNRPTNQPKRSATFDLFAYPGELPKYHPAQARRASSTIPNFPTRSDPSTQPIEPIMSSNNKNSNPTQPIRHSSASTPFHHHQHHQQQQQHHHHQPSSTAHKPFTQKINLKDLDSLDFILNMGLHPHSQNSPPKARSAPQATKPSNYHPTHSRDISSSAPDPYLTFERAWGQSLDGIVDGIVDREIDPRRYPNNSGKSNTEPISLTTRAGRTVHRSATVRSADSDHRSSSDFDHHSHRRPRSAGGEDGLNHWAAPYPPNSSSPQRFSTRSPPRTAANDYLPSSYHAQNRRMSTGGHDKLYSAQRTHPHQQPNLYRHPSHINTSISSLMGCSARANGSGGVSRGTPTTTTNNNHNPSGTTTSATSPSTSDRPASSSNTSRRSRASTIVPEYHPSHDNQAPNNHNLKSEFKEVIVRFERQSDGSTRLSRQVMSRTVDLDGTVHDRFRRQRAAAVI